MREILTEVVAANRVIVLMVYGLVFFVMGLAIALQSMRRSRLAIAGSLRWLAAFGILHGLHEWGHLFIPLQAEYMPSTAIDALVVVQAVLLATSYACLYQFGVELLRPLPLGQRLASFLPGATLAVWGFLAAGPTVEVARDVQDWHRINSILARYSMCLPGALLAAAGLVRRSREIDLQLSVPGIGRPFRLAAYALVGYAIFSGVFVPTGGHFPANLVNDERVAQLFVLPVEMFRSLTGAVLAFGVIRGMQAFEIELDRLIFDMEQQTVLARERERIGRDLHDHTLQKVYAAGLVLRAAERGPDARSRGARLADGLALLDDAVDDIRRYIGGLEPGEPRCSLVSGLLDLVSDPGYRSLIEIDFDHDLPDDCGLDTAVVTHLLAITREALSNAVRHSGADRVRVSARAEPHELTVRISDEGRGLPADIIAGYGLRNMRDRARSIGAEIDITGGETGGTAVTVTLDPGRRLMA